jgi:hypothetical protein
VSDPSRNGTTDGGFAAVPYWVMREYGRLIGPDGIGLYAALRSYANGEGTCWPSYGTLADLLGTQRLTVIRCVRRLESAGLIQVDRRPNRPNVFHLSDPRGSKSEPLRGVQKVNPRGSKNEPQGSKSEPPGVQKVNPNKNQEQEPKNKNQRTRTKGDATAEILPELDTPEFRESWDRWLAYKRQKKKPYAPQTSGSVLKKLAALGPSRAVANIEEAIGQGWQGIRDVHWQTDKKGAGAAGNGSPPRGGLHPKNVEILEHFNRKQGEGGP